MADEIQTQETVEEVKVDQELQSLLDVIEAQKDGGSKNGKLFKYEQTDFDNEVLTGDKAQTWVFKFPGMAKYLDLINQPEDELASAGVSRMMNKCIVYPRKPKEFDSWLDYFDEHEGYLQVRSELENFLNKMFIGK